MGTGGTDEFRKDAERIELTGGLSRRPVADELGGGLSILNKRVQAHRDMDVASPEERELAREGWLYLAVILNLHSRRVIGWAVSNRMKRDPAIRALKAIARRPPPRGCIFLSDRGLQASMSGKGNCHVNAAVETFFKTIKAELIWRRSVRTRRQAETATFRFIDGFCNPADGTQLACERHVAYPQFPADLPDRLVRHGPRIGGGPCLTSEKFARRILAIVIPRYARL